MTSDVLSQDARPAGTRVANEIALGERCLAAAFLAVGLVLRLFYIWHYRIDSDEPQHLHVVWAWTQGQLPYRDVFDNHSPLYQALSAPLFHFLGERADIVLFMRVAQLPIFALTLYCVWKITARFFPPRTAWWTTVLAALLPPLHFFGDGWFLSSIEYRPDQLWTLVWLLILLVLTAGPITPPRALTAGVLLGAAFGVSMKTTLFLLALGQAGIALLLLRFAPGGEALRDTDAWRWPVVVGRIAIGLAGILLVPGLICLYFWLHGAATELYYDVIGHNLAPDSAEHVLNLNSFWRWLRDLPVAVAGGWIISRLQRPPGDRARIAFLFFSAWFYLTSLLAFWPVITAEDYLPFFPAFMLSLGPVVLWLGTFAGRRVVSFAGPLLAGVEVIVLLATISPWEDQTADKIGIIADTLKLTSPEDFVMDSKGETIYRRRASHYVLEKLTFHRMHLGLIPDEIAQRLIRTRAPLATTRRMPRHGGRLFIEENYVPIAYRLRVAGKVVRDPSERTDRPCEFEIAVPQRYTLITPDGPPQGLLDDMPFTGPRELVAGSHRFVPSQKAGKLVVIWAQALERGYSPFAPIKADVKTLQD